MIDASRAGPPSPVEAASPFPAKAVMIPVAAEIFRIRLAPGSAIRRSPEASRARAPGSRNDAWRAGPPSPAEPYSPLPAIVEILWVAASTLRMRREVESEMKRFPARSNARPTGLKMLAPHAGRPSPEELAAPFPA